MTAPERIWLQDGGDFDAASEVTWCQHSIDDADTEYVRADLSAIDVHPDPRDEVIARLVEAGTLVSDWDEWAFQVGGICPDRLVNCMGKLRAALAAAKAVQP